MKQTIDISNIGWFWAVNRHREIDYYVKNYAIGKLSDEYTRQLMSPRNLGNVIMFNFLSMHPELLGTLIRHYTQNIFLSDYSTFGGDMSDFFNPQTHHIYEIIWASFRGYIFPVRMIADLFGIRDHEVREHYAKLDEEFKINDPFDEVLYYELVDDHSHFSEPRTVFHIYDEYTVPCNENGPILSKLEKGNEEVWDETKYRVEDHTRNKIFSIHHGDK